MWLCSRHLKVMTVTVAAAKLSRVAYNFGMPTIDLTETERLALAYTGDLARRAGSLLLSTS